MKEDTLPVPIQSSCVQEESCNEPNSIHEVLEKSSKLDAERIRAFADKLTQNRVPKLTLSEKNGLQPSNHQFVYYAMCSETFGTADADLINSFVKQIVNVSLPLNVSLNEKVNAHLAAVNNIKPQDSLEGMLAVQMVTVHNLAMNFITRAMNPEQTAEMVNTNVERANKLMRTFTSQIEALNHYRGKGQQKITVEHIHVNDGGQAIVGHVSRAKGVGKEPS